MTIEQVGWFYTIIKDEEHYTVLVTVPENHKPNTTESEVVLILDGMDKPINDVDLYDEFEELLISEGFIE